jgi:hypothetical protein
MVRYWYSLPPLVVVLTVIPLALPWLGLIALMLFALIALAALGALAWGIVYVPHTVVRMVGRRRQSRSGTRRQQATLSAARPSVRPAQSMPAGAALLVASPPSESERLT